LEAHRVHPIVDPTKFWEGVGDDHADDGHSSPLTAISQPKIHTNAYVLILSVNGALQMFLMMMMMVAGAPAQTPLGSLQHSLVPLGMDSEAGCEEGN